jgi:hypothetical protein
MICPWCGSPDFTLIEWAGATGVTSPDGWQEYRREEGYRCNACGGLESL